MSVQSFQRVNSLLASLILATLALVAGGCATSAPVQEMSNARQTIASALEVKADIYAPKHLEAAEKLMEQASEALESGDYELARESAVAAQQYAVKARQQAISRQK
jgi:phage shock protein A